MKKLGRNDPCICGSGKKFKKCCENKLLGKKYFAEDLTQKFSGKLNLTSLFQDTTKKEVVSEQKPPLQEKPEASSEEKSQDSDKSS